MKCIKCGKDNENYICSECRQMLREKSADFSEYECKIEKLISQLDSDEKDYALALILTDGYTGVFKGRRAWLYESFLNKPLDKFDIFEKNKIRGWLLDALYQDYEYEMAENIANELSQQRDLPYSAMLPLIDFYTKTRRYEAAEAIIDSAIKSYGNIPSRNAELEKFKEENNRRYEKSLTGKGEYMPNSKENKDEVKGKYVAFLKSLGIEAEIPKHIPKPIPKDEYPKIKCTINPSFDSYVAYDLETTGLSSTKDSIIEIGAIKVLGGRIVESKEFLFGEFVKPYKSKISGEIEKLTGISNSDVENAREMWDVVSDFLDFAGDLTLVGYNNSKFDNAFLERAGRYCNRVIKNKSFDVLRYANDNKCKIRGCNGMKLTELSQCLGIKNPKAHRAYADAITTAKVFEKIKKMK